MKLFITLFILEQLRHIVAFQQSSRSEILRCQPLNLGVELKQYSLQNQRIKSTEYALSYCNSKEKNNSDSFNSLKDTQLSTSIASSFSFANNRKTNFRIFCDLDGVLCDFDAGVRLLSQGRSANSLPSELKWDLIAKADRFYERLPWTVDGERLWKAIRPQCPNILTGVSNEKICPMEKAKWCARELGVATNHVHKASDTSEHTIIKGKPQDDMVNIITCWSGNKHYESGERAVLIDDREDLAANWRAKGGIFIHHINTERTLNQLREHGIIPKNISP